MENKALEIILNSPQGIEALDSWVLLQWLDFFLGIAAITMLFIVLGVLLNYVIKNDV